MLSASTIVNRSTTWSAGTVERAGGMPSPPRSPTTQVLPVKFLHVDDQRVAFPAADRVAHPQLDVRSGMRAAVQADDAIEMIVLVEDHHLAGRLLDLPAVVVAVERAARRTRRQAADAVIVNRPRLERVIANVGFLGERPRLPGDLAVGRIDHRHVSGRMRTVDRARPCRRRAGRTTRCRRSRSTGSP